MNPNQEAIMVEMSGSALAAQASDVFSPDRQCGEAVAFRPTARDGAPGYHWLFESNPLPMWTYDPFTSRILAVNHAALRMYGYTESEFLSLRTEEFQAEKPEWLWVSPPENGERIQRTGPVLHRRVDGSSLWVELTIHEVQSAEDTLCFVLAQDVTERVRLLDEITRVAQQDPLTGVPNRMALARFFRDAVFRARTGGLYFALLAIDFDGFKQINDRFGNPAGDRFLIEAVRRFRSRLRDTDVLVRMGGDEFVVLAERLRSPDDASVIAGNLIEAMSGTTALDGRCVRSSISVGIAVFPHDGGDLDSLLRAADRGLRQARRCGRRCSRRVAALRDHHGPDAVEVQEMLCSGIEQGLFHLQYQPQCTPDGRLRRLEALVRMRHPRLGYLSPASFIPIAEETGQIAGIGEWVLTEACRQTNEWKGQGLEIVPVSVNVSAVQLRSGDLPEIVRRVLQETGTDPAWLELELTESVLMENLVQSRQQLDTLQKIGVRIAIDDFGTGYSSLSCLHSLPLNTLKIDRSFVRNLGDDDGGSVALIVKAIADVGRNLGLTVVAEGVETEQQRDQLARFGCDLLQGFLFSAPVDPAEIVGRLGEAPQLLEAAHG